MAHQTQVHPHAIDLGLERLRVVLQRLAWRQPTVPVITVAGTNGKGSVTAYCSAILKAAGYRVGTFTSPHLRDYRERIRIHDRLVTAAELVAAFELIEAARVARPEISLTFFEYNALAAFLVFHAVAVNAWVLEVGMGGRLDAVNVVDPSVAVVVSIGLDHEAFLGSTLDAIAGEKAGIFRCGRPAVLGSRDMPPRLYAAAREVGARLKQLGGEFDYAGAVGCPAERGPAERGPAERGPVASGAACWHYRGNTDLPCLPPPALRGEIQIANAATAIAAIEELPLAVPADAVACGLRSVQLPGRFQLIQPNSAAPAWILDVAHNPDAARVLRDNLAAQPVVGRSFAVCGVLADKDASGIARLLARSFDAWWVVTTEGVRGVAAAQLVARIAAEVQAPLTAIDDIADACSAALAGARTGDRIVVFGSFHTVGPALQWLESRSLLPSAA